MISGGGLVERTPPFTPLTGFLFYNGVPLAISAVILFALYRRPRDAGGVLLGMLPIGIVLTRISSSAAIGALDDLPRVFGILSLALALIAPRTASRMFGIPAPVAAMILALPLALEAALEASYHGRGWVDVPSMIALAILLGLRTRRISARSKTIAAGAFAAVGALNAAWLVHRGYDPFAKDDMFEGTLADTHFESGGSAAQGVLTDEAKSRVALWLRERVRPGDTCFVYGTSSMLYDLLECKNPSRLDITISDFFTAEDGVQVVGDLRRSPPEWIIAAESHWTNPDLATPFTGDESIYWSGPNGAAAKVLHIGVGGLLDRYDVVGETSEALRGRPELIAQADAHPEKPHRFRLYHRRPLVADR